MHELSLCLSIFRIVDDARQQRPVETVNLQVGELRQVIPETLERCWEVVTYQTPLEGSRLEIDPVPVELVCMHCPARTFATHPLVLLECGSCGSAQVVVMSGEELTVTAIDVREAVRQQVHG